MKVKQLSVFMENTPGRLAEMATTLGDAGINIMALTVAESSDFGVVRIIVNKPEDARNALHKKGFTITENNILAIEIPNRPGSLGRILSNFAERGLNVEYMYAFVAKREGAIIVFRFDNTDRAIEALKGSDVKILAHEEVLSLEA